MAERERSADRGRTRGLVFVFSRREKSMTANCEANKDATKGRCWMKEVLTAQPMSCSIKLDVVMIPERCNQRQKRKSWTEVGWNDTLGNSQSLVCTSVNFFHIIPIKKITKKSTSFSFSLSTSSISPHVSVAWLHLLKLSAGKQPSVGSQHLLVVDSNSD